MADFAVDREAGLEMIRIGGAAIVVEVTTGTLGGRGSELEGALILMTGSAVQGGVGSEQGEQGAVVPVEEVAPILPTVGRVAGLALEAQFTGMGVGMAVGTGDGDVREDRARVTLRALGLLVVADESEAGRVVVEAQRFAQRQPSFDGMALAAGSLEVAVGAGFLSLGRPGPGADEETDEKGEEQAAPAAGDGRRRGRPKVGEWSEGGHGHRVSIRRCGEPCPSSEDGFQQLSLIPISRTFHDRARPKGRFATAWNLADGRGAGGKESMSRHFGLPSFLRIESARTARRRAFGR